MRSPYVIKLPYDFTKVLNGLMTFGIFVLCLSLGILAGILLASLSDNSKGLVATALFLTGLLLPWVYLIINDIYFRPNRNSIYKKWFYIPNTDNKSSELSNKAWIRCGTSSLVIEKPGFYVLKPGCFVEYVGTSEDKNSFLNMRMNGGV